MCNMNERPPTPTEQQNITHGWKVFIETPEKTLITPFQKEPVSYNTTLISIPYTIYKREKCSNVTENGYHVFLKWKHAKQFANLILWKSDLGKILVLKVKIKNIFAIGQIDDSCVGSEITEPDSVMRCEQITITKRRN